MNDSKASSSWSTPPTGMQGAKESVGSLTSGEIQAWLIDRLARELKIEPHEIDVQAPLTLYGLDSLEAVTLSAELEELVGIELSPTLLWEYSTIEDLANYLVGQAISSPAKNETKGEAGAEPAYSTSSISAHHNDFSSWPEYIALQERVENLERQGSINPYFRVHQGVTTNTTLIDGREFINYSSYNYLGMSGDPFVSQAAQEAITRYGTSVSASRVIAGEKPLHGELETAIAHFIGTEACLVFVGGHATNVTAIGHLMGPKDLILYDSLIHNSVQQGAQLAGARSVAFPHNDWHALDQILENQRHHYNRVLVVIEGIYSADGDIPNLPQFVAVKQRHDALLMVDEAHSIGVLGETGRGISEYHGVLPASVDLWMGTLSKALASCGGYIAGSKALIEYLKYTAAGFVYSVGITPPDAAAALAAIKLLQREPQRVVRLRERSQLFLELARAQGLNVGASHNSPIIPVILGNTVDCLRLSQALFLRGINVQPMIYPAVLENAARLRFFITCDHTAAQIHSTIETLAAKVAKLTS